ncbi:Imm21 family immunity protein [Thermomonospora echinospora]|uniref:Imm21 family immunity protein n=1 Tax=Thermomonospora echinospora TaxID=1992 RepID=UPI002E153825
MRVSSFAVSDAADAAPGWVESMGGPLIVVPVSALAGWGGCTMTGMVNGDGDVADDYDRACAVEDLAGVIAVGRAGAQGLVLAEEPATSCWAFPPECGHGFQAAAVRLPVVFS